MTYCPAHIFGAATGLCCARTDAHFTGHIYLASAAPDRHTEEPTDD